MDQIPDLLQKSAELDPDKCALEEWETGKSVSYRALDDRAGRVASMLKAGGVAEGDRVAIACRNRIAFFEVLFACARLGAILVPLNWRMPAAEMAGLIALTEPVLALSGAEDLETIGAAAPGLPVIGLDDPSAEGYEARLGTAGVLPSRSFWPATDCWYLLFTSGTTGRPKAVIQTYGMALANYINIGRAIGLNAGDTTLNFLPLFHTAGINLHTLPTLFEGGSVLIIPAFDPGTVLSLAAAGRFQTFFAVPTVYQALAEHPFFAVTDLSAVRHWGCGGAPLPDHLVRLYAARDIMVCNGMGMTETGPTLFLMQPEKVTAKVGSIGKPQLLSRVRIAAAEKGAGDVGEFQIKGPAVTPGYWRDDAATAEAFTADGWLKTGDLGWIDGDGFYYAAGRSKEMFISGGENVYPKEVENVLCAHPGIADAAVIGVPDEKWGEVGKAFIQPVEGSKTDQTAFRDWCRQNLAAYKVPRYFTIVDDFPRTAAGKIQKHLLPGAARHG
ncbi:acid--CoA ligase [Aquisalinus flavus]|uniref:3-methylmercaptopropionyl-CoA ligase n=1 Tax=Aquisalinus flavus TaxID=1526572 RepID=A0A8J2V6H1_9PROT|nr:AMP-binding protein [Aquisalinus flavus]MBD0428146.1 AMP-binding protein [Aquisalinus flavus]GGD18312.1 acid--CoA ligase [Aquisalinus flavus]